MTNDYLTKKVFRSYLAISIMAMIAATIGMLVDGIVIGQFLGQECVSAFGIASPVFIFVAAAAGIFSNGGTACCSNHIGRGSSDTVRLNFTVTIVGTLVLGILLTVVCLFWGDALAGFLGASGELTKYTGDYIRGIGIGGIPIMLSQVLMYYIRLDNDSKLSFISTLFMTATNITLDILFGTILHMGMFGMGLATSISYLICLLVCATHFLKKDNIFKLTSMKNGFSELKDVIVTGIPSALNRACMTVRGIFLNHLLMTLGGSLAVSALAVQNNINQLLSSVTMGVGMTTMLMVGIFFGERDKKALSKTLKVSLRSGVLLSLITIFLVIIFAQPLVGLFLNSSPEGKALAVRSLRLFCVSLPFSLVCVVLLNYYQCTKNLFMANLICICHGLLFVVAVSWGLSFALKTDGVWVSFLIAELLTLLVVVVVSKVKCGHWPKSLSDIMLLPKGFEPEDEHILNLSLKNDMNQVLELSRRVEEFCSKYSKDEEKIAKLALCIEEMAGNIVRHGFKDNREHFIDIRIIVSEDSIIFRMRDDGMKFNPIQYADKNQKDVDAMGIAVIQKIAVNMEYSVANELNNLMIVL